VIYDAVEKAHEIILANYATDMAAVIASKAGLTGIVATATIEKRQDVRKSITLGAAKPTISIWGRGADTQAKVGTGWRDNVNAVLLDYFCNGTDPVAVAIQAELAAEALMRCVDKMPNSGGSGGVFGAAEMVGSARVDLSDGYEKDGAGKWYRTARVTFPLTDRDEPV
jgi:hypothetical protein